MIRTLPPVASIFLPAPYPVCAVNQKGDQMKPLLFAAGVLCANAAYAYEYKLQFTPQAGARNLAVAGYQFNANMVIGNCSYDTVTAGSGRGGRSITTHHYNTCSWDLGGNLISLTPVATPPVAPVPLSQIGTEIIYAIEGVSSTGFDTRGFGFVSTPSSHYSWQTTNGLYVVIPYSVYTVTATLVSDGDLPLAFDAASVAASVSGTITPSAGSPAVSSTTCSSSVPVGSTCAVTISYNPKTIKCTPSPYGFAYTRIDLSLVTDAGATIDFTQAYTITGVPICDD